MDRELTLATLLLLLAGPALCVTGALALRLPADTSPRRLEQQAWRRLWLPVLPALLVVAFLGGWALQEPETSEAAGPVALAAAGLFAAIWVRALIRAARASRRPPRPALAMTTGLLRPRVFVAPELAARLDERALRAAHEHEAAHARHRDPLRLWLAQLATDLQWPAGPARRRFAEWRDALELARDAEACERVEGSDLAAALIEAARLAHPAAGTPATAGLVHHAGSASAFSDRIYRLLDEAPDHAPPIRGWRTWLPVVSAIALALAAGLLFGEALVALLLD